MVSIIIPVYNAEQYLTRCLDSVQAQTYAPIEIVLIDDGSTDSSPAICDEYANKHDNIHVLHIPNGGASLARKKGIEVAMGEYLTFIDSDDYVAPNYVSSMYDLTEKYGTKISACGVKRVEANEYENEYEDKNENEKLLNFDELMPRFFKYEFWGFPGGLYHRSVFEGLTFPKATLSEDYYVKTQMFCRERQMAATNAPLYFYEYHPTSLSHTKISERAFEEFDNVKAVYDYTKIHCPEYSDYALSNVVETALKLFNQISKSIDRQYDALFRPIDVFLLSNARKIQKTNRINTKIKFLANCVVACPLFAKVLNKYLL